MIAKPPPDSGLPDLGVLLDPSAMADAIETALIASGSAVSVAELQPTYVRYKPGTSCLVGYSMSFANPDVGVVNRLPVSVSLYRHGRVGEVWRHSAFQHLIARAAKRHPTPVTQRAALMTSIPAIVEVYPLDRALGQLVRAADRGWAARAIAGMVAPDMDRLRTRRVDLFRYRPHRKALLEYRLPAARYLVKAYADARATRVDAVGRRLVDAGVPVARPLGVHIEDRLAFQAHVPGTTLSSLRGHSSYVDGAAAAAEALQRLHRLPGDDSLTPDRAHNGIAHKVDDASGALALLLPGQARFVRRLADRLRSGLPDAASRQTGLIHGDFYDEQVIVGGDGVTLIDLDECGPGEPLLDAGNFLAHLIAAGAPDDVIAASRDVFLRAEPGASAAALAHFEAIGLFLIAMAPFRQLEPEWPQAIVRRLELADYRLIEALPHPVRVKAVELIRHKPGRRWTARAYLDIPTNGPRQPIYIKRYSSERATRVAEAYAVLHTALEPLPAAPRVPALLRAFPEEHVVVVGHVAGAPVVERLLDGDVRLAAAVADALHRLHTCGARLPRRRGLADELASLDDYAARLGAAIPEIRRTAWQAVNDLRRAGERPWRWRDRPLHRDFYPAQVLADGVAIGFIDLDDAQMGEPALDVANFAAHLRLLAAQQPTAATALEAVERAFVGRLRELDPTLDAELVSLLIGATCLRLADIHFGRDGNTEVARSLIEEACRCVRQSIAA